MSRPIQVNAVPAAGLAKPAAFEALWVMTLVQPSELGPPLDDLRVLVGEDWAGVNRLIYQRLGSDVALVNQVAHHIIHNGGKRLRPLAVLLSSRACGCDHGNQIHAAAIIEFIHTATLLHDDVVDSSGLRRGQQTANSLFGNQASVLVGDFLYSRAFQMMVELKELSILEVLANATNTIAEGEVLQLMNCHNPEITEADYMEVIYRKTAKLFEAGSRIGAILARQSESTEQALVGYGRHLGLAFQLVDDALDYDAKPEELGKNIGDDLADGKPTLPLIYAMKHGSAAEKHMIREAIETGSTQNLRSIQLAIETSGGLRYTAERAEREAEVAVRSLEGLPWSKFKDGLIGLAQFAVKRRF